MNKFWRILPVFLLTGCTVGPDYERPDFYADAQIADSLNMREKSDVSLERRWYEFFNDATLNKLVCLAKRRNLDVKIAVQRLRQARYALDIARSAYLPALDAQGAYTRTKASRNNPVSVRERYYTTGLDASWEIDVWGAGRRRTEQAGALYAANAVAVEDVLIAVRAEVVSVYFSLRAAREQMAVLKKNIGLQKTLYDLSSELYQSGLGNLADLNQAKYALEKMTAQLPALEYAARESKNALTLLTGKLPAALDALLNADSDNAAQATVVFDFDTLYALPVGLIRARPDVRRAELELMAQNAAVGQAVAAMYPNFSVSALIGLQSEPLSKLFSSNSETYQVEPSLGAPLFHWGALLNRVRAQKAVKEQYVLQYQKTLLSAVTDVKNRINMLEAQQKKTASVRESLESVQTVVSLNLLRYRKGLIPLNELLTQTQLLLETQQDFIATKLSVCQGIAAFYKAMGV